MAVSEMPRRRRWESEFGSGFSSRSSRDADVVPSPTARTQTTTTTTVTILIRGSRRNVAKFQLSETNINYRFDFAMRQTVTRVKVQGAPRRRPQGVLIKRSPLGSLSVTSVAFRWDAVGGGGDVTPASRDFPMDASSRDTTPTVQFDF